MQRISKFSFRAMSPCRIQLLLLQAVIKVLAVEAAMKLNKQSGQALKVRVAMVVLGRLCGLAIDMARCRYQKRFAADCCGRGSHCGCTKIFRSDRDGKRARRTRRLRRFYR